MVLDVSIILPDRIFWRRYVAELILPTLSGQMGVLTDHIPVFTGLESGILYVRGFTSGVPHDYLEMFFVTGGFAIVDKNIVTILVGEAESSSEINSEETEQEFFSCKKELETTQDPKKKFELGARFKRLRAKYQIVQERKKIK